MNIKALLGEKISKLRKEKGYSQIKFAEKLGMSTNGLSIIETGRGFLTAETLEKILSEFNLTPDELFSFGSFNSSEEILNDIQRQLNSLNGNQDKLEIIHKFIKTLL